MRTAGALLALLIAACDGNGTHLRGPETKDASSAAVVPWPEAPLADDAPTAQSASSAASAAAIAIATSRAAAARAASAVPLPNSSGAAPIARGALTATTEDLPLSGVVLDARWEWPSPPGARSEDAADASRARRVIDHKIELWAPGQLRWTFASASLPLPLGTEVRVDLERQFLVWPDKKRYRELSPGTLHALFAERRVDVLPLARGTVRDAGRGVLLRRETRKYEVESSFGVVSLEVAVMKEAGLGAQPFCTTLMQLAGVSPTARVCAAGPEPEVALSATFRWHDRPHEVGARFVVTAVAPHAGDEPVFALVPPDATVAQRGVPGPSHATFLSRDELAALRTRGANGSPRPGADESAATVAATNASDRVLYLIIDGAKAAYLGPHEKVLLAGLRGRHEVVWRSFFGDMVSTPLEVESPQSITFPVVAKLGGSAAKP
ncbi:MAG: hypothetical protein EXR75_10710 [Myxococcales bacterium]|nr:hypothetical protein [Myxococcales bacterium]